MNEREIKELKDNLEAEGLKVISICSNEEVRILLKEMERKEHEQKNSK